MAIGKSILHSPTKYCHLKLFIEILFKKSISCVMLNLPQKLLGSLVAIVDSNWYIKRLNRMEIDFKKMRYFGPLSHIFPLPPLFQTLSSGPDKAVIPQVRTTHYGLQSFRFAGAQLWNELPNCFRKETSLNQFKILSTHGMVVHNSVLPANQNSLSAPFIYC